MSLFDLEPNPNLQSTLNPLTPTERDVVEQARQDGYLVRSGHRLAVLNSWREWCRQTGRKCVVGIAGKRQATIQVNGLVVMTCELGDLEQAAAKVAEQTEDRPPVPSLADGRCVPPGQ